jgi:hypothetical protein
MLSKVSVTTQSQQHMPREEFGYHKGVRYHNQGSSKLIKVKNNHLAIINVTTPHSSSYPSTTSHIVYTTIVVVK